MGVRLTMLITAGGSLVNRRNLLFLPIAWIAIRLTRYRVIAKLAIVEYSGCVAFLEHHRMDLIIR